MSEEKISKKVDKDFAKEFNSVGVWSKQQLKLKSFANKLIGGEDAQPILICKGKYENCGPPTPAEPHLNAQVFALSRRSRFQVRAQCVGFLYRWKWGIGPEFVIDNHFMGWFEVLSEEGNGAPFRSVSELALCTNRKTVFMVTNSMHAHQRTSEGEWESCTLHIGFCVTVAGQILTTGLPDCGCGRLLRCEVAQPLGLPSETVYLPMEGPGKLTDILLITGNGFDGMRFPFYVKLVEGSPRPIDFEGFTPYMRFLSMVSKEVLTVWPMTLDTPLVHIPIECEMELKVLDNLKQVQELPLYPEIRRCVEEAPLPKYKLKETDRPSHPQPSTSGLSLTSEDKNYIYYKDWLTISCFVGREYPLALAAPKYNSPSMETGSMKPCVEQLATGIATADMEKNNPVDIKCEEAKDVLRAPNLDGTHLKMCDSEPVKKDLQTSRLAAAQSVRRSLRIKTLHEKDDQETCSTAAANTGNNRSLNTKSDKAKDQQTLNLKDFKIKRRRFGTHEEP